MLIEEKIKILKSFDLFRDLSHEQIKIIADAVHEKEFEPKTIFIEQATEADVAYFIYEGGVRVYRITPEGDEVNLSIGGAGEIIGEMALLDHGPRSANVETIQKTKALTLTQNKFKNILETHPQIAFSLLLILASKIRKTGEIIEEMLSQKLPQRTWHVLELLSKYFPEGEITLSQEELSQIIGATRARVTETLNLLEQEGKIELHHKKIKII